MIGRLLILLGTVVGLDACYRSRSDEPLDPGGIDDSRNEPAATLTDYPLADALHPGPPPICGDEGQGCSVVEDCAGSWAPGPLPPPWWLSHPPSECVQAPRHDLLEYLDDCSGNQTPATSCGAGVGAAVCSGVVTTLCRTAADCPEGFACTDGAEPIETPPQHRPGGTCAKTCDPGGDPLQCIRCDQVCNTAGICNVVHAHGG